MSTPPPPLHVRILSPQKLILDTSASSVSSKNMQGKFDILPYHANFVTLIENDPIIVRESGSKKPITFTFPLAIIVCLDNQVNIYTYAH